MRSIAPGAKFSTITSHASINLVKITFPPFDLVFSVMLRLLWFSIVKYKLSTSGMSRSWLRVASPFPGRSTLMTSRSEPREELGTRGPRLDVRHVQNSYPGQSLHRSLRHYMPTLARSKSGFALPEWFY